MAKKRDYLIVDGYNIIHCWDELKKIAEYSLQDSRTRLLEILANYQGMKNLEILVVFDAHLILGGLGSYEKYNDIHIVYTKESQTADEFIERFTAENSKYRKIKVATNDNLEQLIILGRGAERISAETLLSEIKNINKEIKTNYLDARPIKNNMLFDNLNPEMQKIIDDMIRGKRR